LNKTCIKKAPPDVHRKAHLEDNGPSLVKSWNEAVDFWGLPEEWATVFPNNTDAATFNRRIILIQVLFRTLH
jgi:hypothetical protein